MPPPAPRSSALTIRYFGTEIGSTGQDGVQLVEPGLDLAQPTQSPGGMTVEHGQRGPPCAVRETRSLRRIEQEVPHLFGREPPAGPPHRRFVAGEDRTALGGRKAKEKRRDVVRR